MPEYTGNTYGAFSRKGKLMKTAAMATAFAFFLMSLGPDILIETADAVTTRMAEGGLTAGYTKEVGELDIVSFSLPRNLGTVEDKWSPEELSGPRPEMDSTVIHIQDAHCNYQAQNTITEILEHLKDEYGIDQVNLEGGRGDYDLTVFTEIGDKQLRAEVADYFLKEGMISGAEMYAAREPGSVKLWGVEDAGLYLKNLSVYRDSLGVKEHTRRCLASLKHHLNDLKARIFSEELLEVDMKYGQYKSGNIGLREYIAYLAERSGELGISLKDHNNLSLLLNALRAEKEIDFKKADRERGMLVDSLRKLLSPAEMRGLLLKTVEFREKAVSPHEFYEYLFSRARMLNMDLSRYPDLLKYREYIAIYSGIDRLAVLREAEDLEAGIRSRLYRDGREKELDRLSRDHYLLENIFGLRLTRNDYEHYLKNKQDFKIGKYISFIEKESSRCGIKSSLEEGIRKLDLYREDLEKFFEYSFERDEAFIRNIRSGRSRETGGGPVVLITGGFHSENLYSLFRKNNISYISIMPKFTDPKGYKCRYFELLAGDGMPEEERILTFLASSNIAVPSFLNGLGVKKTERITREILVKLVAARKAGRRLRLIAGGRTLELGERGPFEELDITAVLPPADSEEAFLARLGEEVFSRDFVINYSPQYDGRPLSMATTANKIEAEMERIIGNYVEADIMEEDVASNFVDGVFKRFDDEYGEDYEYLAYEGDVEKGKVTLRIFRGEGDGEVSVVISDNGSGIPYEIMDKWKEEFTSTKAGLAEGDKVYYIGGRNQGIWNILNSALNNGHRISFISRVSSSEGPAFRFTQNADNTVEKARLVKNTPGTTLVISVPPGEKTKLQPGSWFDSPLWEIIAPVAETAVAFAAGYLALGLFGNPVTAAVAAAAVFYLPHLVFNSKAAGSPAVAVLTAATALAFFLHAAGIAAPLALFCLIALHLGVNLTAKLFRNDLFAFSDAAGKAAAIMHFIGIATVDILRFMLSVVVRSSREIESGTLLIGAMAEGAGDFYIDEDLDETPEEELETLPYFEEEGVPDLLMLRRDGVPVIYRDSEDRETAVFCAHGGVVSDGRVCVAPRDNIVTVSSYLRLLKQKGIKNVLLFSCNAKQGGFTVPHGMKVEYSLTLVKICPDGRKIGLWTEAEAVDGDLEVSGRKEGALERIRRKFSKKVSAGIRGLTADLLGVFSPRFSGGMWFDDPRWALIAPFVETGALMYGGHVLTGFLAGIVGINLVAALPVAVLAAGIFYFMHNFNPEAKNSATVKGLTFFTFAFGAVTFGTALASYAIAVLFAAHLAANLYALKDEYIEAAYTVKRLRRELQTPGIVLSEEDILKERIPFLQKLKMNPLTSIPVSALAGVLHIAETVLTFGGAIPAPTVNDRAADEAEGRMSFDWAVVSQGSGGRIKGVFYPSKSYSVFDGEGGKAGDFRGAAFIHHGHNNERGVQVIGDTEMHVVVGHLADMFGLRESGGALFLDCCNPGRGGIGGGTDIPVIYSRGDTVKRPGGERTLRAGGVTMTIQEVEAEEKWIYSDAEGREVDLREYEQERLRSLTGERAPGTPDLTVGGSRGLWAAFFSPGSVLGTGKALTLAWWGEELLFRLPAYLGLLKMGGIPGTILYAAFNLAFVLSHLRNLKSYRVEHPESGPVRSVLGVMGVPVLLSLFITAVVLPVAVSSPWVFMALSMSSHLLANLTVRLLPSLELWPAIIAQAPDIESAARRLVLEHGRAVENSIVGGPGLDERIYIPAEVRAFLSDLDVDFMTGLEIIDRAKSIIESAEPGVSGTAEVSAPEAQKDSSPAGVARGTTVILPRRETREEPFRERSSGRIRDKRTVVHADVHGELGGFRENLFEAGIIDEKGNWIGGESVLVQQGDLIDRGPRSREVVDYILELQRQAREAGGDVVILLGNHELMLLQGHLKYLYQALTRQEGLSHEEAVDEIWRLRERLKDLIARGNISGAYHEKGYLFVHGGLRTKIREHLDSEVAEQKGISPGSVTGNDRKERINEVLKLAVESDDYSHPIFNVDRSRGGYHEIGGIFWTDYRDLAGSFRAGEQPQQVGHTPERRPGAGIRGTPSMRRINGDAGLFDGYGGNRAFVSMENGDIKAVEKQEDGVYRARVIGQYEVTEEEEPAGEAFWWSNWKARDEEAPLKDRELSEERSDAREEVDLKAIAPGTIIRMKDPKNWVSYTMRVEEGGMVSIWLVNNRGCFVGPATEIGDNGVIKKNMVLAFPYFLYDESVSPNRLIAFEEKRHRPDQLAGWAHSFSEFNVIPPPSGRMVAGFGGGENVGRGLDLDAYRQNRMPGLSFGPGDRYRVEDGLIEFGGDRIAVLYSEGDITDSEGRTIEDSGVLVKGEDGLFYIIVRAGPGIPEEEVKDAVLHEFVAALSLMGGIDAETESEAIHLLARDGQQLNKKDYNAGIAAEEGEERPAGRDEAGTKRALRDRLTVIEDTGRILKDGASGVLSCFAQFARTLVLGRPLFALLAAVTGIMVLQFISPAGESRAPPLRGQAAQVSEEAASSSKAAALTENLRYSEGVYGPV
ncbi:MAG: hypothetical protein GF408_02025, partial [Candidatus Omnitrophica bacterium]|nr:hypothetical protein [Candidatus Omnitrophota bacterium]